MSYEQLREQCAQIAEKMPDFSRDAFGPVQHRIATTIRALPLPDVMQEPVAWLYHGAKDKFPIPKDNMLTTVMISFKKMGHRNETALYALPPDAEALRKENEQLRERITEIERISYSARCALQADVNDRDEVIANCSDKIRILESKLAALKGGAA